MEINPRSQITVVRNGEKRPLSHMPAELTLSILLAAGGVLEPQQEQRLEQLSQESGSATLPLPFPHGPASYATNVVQQQQQLQLQYQLQQQQLAMHAHHRQELSSQHTTGTLLIVCADKMCEFEKLRSHVLPLWRHNYLLFAKHMSHMFLYFFYFIF